MWPPTFYLWICFVVIWSVVVHSKFFVYATHKFMFVPANTWWSPDLHASPVEAGSIIIAIVIECIIVQRQDRFISHIRLKITPSIEGRIFRKRYISSADELYHGLIVILEKLNVCVFEITFCSGGRLCQFNDTDIATRRCFLRLEFVTCSQCFSQMMDRWLGFSKSSTMCSSSSSYFWQRWLCSI